MTKHKTLIGRGEVLQFLGKFGEERLPGYANVVGFAPGKPAPAKPKEMPWTLPLPQRTSGDLPKAQPFREARQPTAQFIRPILKRVFEESEITSGEPQWLTDAKPYRYEEEEGREKIPTPPFQELMPWRRLWPLLKNILSSSKKSKHVNIPKVTDMIAKGEPILSLPKKKVSKWTPHCCIIADYSERNYPFRKDINLLLDRLENMRGKFGMNTYGCQDGIDRICLLQKGLQERVPFSLPPEGTPILILGDLGCFDPSGSETDDWIRFGKRLQKAGLRPVALTPAPPRLWREGLEETFHLIPWGDSQKPSSSRRAGSQAPSLSEEGAKAGAVGLLALLSPATYAEPELIRAVRLMLPPHEADSGTESEAWLHRDVITDIFLSINPSEVLGYKERFRQSSPERKEKVAQLIESHHRNASPFVQDEERGTLDDLLDRPGKEGSEAFLNRVAKSFFTDDLPGTSDWIGRIISRQAPSALLRRPAYSIAWMKANEASYGKEDFAFPNSINIRAISWMLSPSPVPRELTLLQVGERLLLCNPGKAGISTKGSFVATLRTNLGYVRIAHEAGTQTIPMPPEGDFGEIPFPREGKLTIESGMEEVTLDLATRPDWAEGIGRDSRGLFLLAFPDSLKARYHWSCPVARGEAKTLQGDWKPAWAETFGADEYGIHATFRYKGVEQRMRFIPPTTFMMGSPKDEPERNKNEHLHKVTLTKGHWMAETACTQELWEAVMGKNPSRFAGKGLPVEYVSWNDVQKFLKRINSEIPGLELRLPTEAEWECACRAGTETPFNFGNKLTTDLANYNGNYPYANGKKGEYRKRTMSVKSFPCNEWGLYEMHGNVYEWCSDWLGDYPVEDAVDPSGAADGVDRVLRGGDWSFNGRSLRSAYRDGHEPAGGFFDTGFRLSRGQ